MATEMICDARKLIKCLLDRTATEEQIIEAEILVRDGCEPINLCRTVLDEFLIKKWQEVKDKSDPSTNEEDRKSRGGKK